MSILSKKTMAGLGAATLVVAGGAYYGFMGLFEEAVPAAPKTNTTAKADPAPMKVEAKAAAVATTTPVVAQKKMLKPDEALPADLRELKGVRADEIGLLKNKEFLNRVSSTMPKDLVDMLLSDWAGGKEPHPGLMIQPTRTGIRIGFWPRESSERNSIISNSASIYMTNDGRVAAKLKHTIYEKQYDDCTTKLMVFATGQESKTLFNGFYNCFDEKLVPTELQMEDFIDGKSVFNQYPNAAFSDKRCSAKSIVITKEIIEGLKKKEAEERQKKEAQQRLQQRLLEGLKNPSSRP